MSIGIVLALVLSGQARASQLPATTVERVTMVRESEVPRLDSIGNCEGGGRSFDLRRVMFLENRSARIDGPNGPLQISVNREYVRIDTANESAARSVYGTNIGYAVEPHGDLDVELKLGYFDSRLVIYWKETFQNRIYRHGLFHIVGEHIESLCAGRGGITTVE